MLLLPRVPPPPRKDAEAEGNTHQVLLGDIFTGAGVGRRVSHGVGEIVGTRQTTDYRMAPAPTPTLGRVGEQPGPRKMGWERTAIGAESLGWGAQGLVNIYHSQKGMGWERAPPTLPHRVKASPGSRAP